MCEKKFALNQHSLLECYCNYRNYWSEQHNFDNFEKFYKP